MIFNMIHNPVHLLRFIVPTFHPTLAFASACFQWVAQAKLGDVINYLMRSSNIKYTGNWAGTSNSGGCNKFPYGRNSAGVFFPSIKWASMVWPVTFSPHGSDIHIQFYACHPSYVLSRASLRALTSRALSNEGLQGVIGWGCKTFIVAMKL